MKKEFKYLTKKCNRMISLICVFIAVTIFIPSTYAYLLMQTPEKKNVFHFGDVAGKVFETNWEDSLLEAGKIYPKDPQIKSTASVPIYVALKITFTRGDKVTMLSDSEYETYVEPYLSFWYKGIKQINPKWIAEGNLSGNEQIFYYKDILKTFGEETEVLFDQVRIESDIPARTLLRFSGWGGINIKVQGAALQSQYVDGDAERNNAFMAMLGFPIIEESSIIKMALDSLWAKPTFKTDLTKIEENSTVKYKLYARKVGDDDFLPVYDKILSGEEIQAINNGTYSLKLSPYLNKNFLKDKNGNIATPDEYQLMVEFFETTVFNKTKMIAYDIDNFHWGTGEHKAFPYTHIMPAFRTNATLVIPTLKADLAALGIPVSAEYVPGCKFYWVKKDSCNNPVDFWPWPGIKTSKAIQEGVELFFDAQGAWDGTMKLPPADGSEYVFIVEIYRDGSCTDMLYRGVKDFNW